MVRLRSCPHCDSSTAHSPVKSEAGHRSENDLGAAPTSVELSAPDRYRFRLWIIKGNEGGSRGDPTTVDAMALRYGVACQDPHTETVCARPPDIDDGGDLDRGNRQIHEPTGAHIPECPVDNPQNCTHACQ